MVDFPVRVGINCCYAACLTLAIASSTNRVMLGQTKDANAGAIWPAVAGADESEEGAEGGS